MEEVVEEYESKLFNFIVLKKSRKELEKIDKVGGTLEKPPTKIFIRRMKNL